MGAGVPQPNPPALALHPQQPLSRLEMFPEDGVRGAQSWQGLRGGTGCAGLKFYEAKNQHSSEAPAPARQPLEHCTSSAPSISPRVRSPTDKLLLGGFCQLQALDPESAANLPGPNTVLALKSLLGFYPAQGHLPPLLTQL